MLSLFTYEEVVAKEKNWMVLKQEIGQISQRVPRTHAHVRFYLLLVLTA